jgi:hypothetical protein
MIELSARSVVGVWRAARGDGKPLMPGTTSAPFLGAVVYSTPSERSTFAWFVTGDGFRLRIPSAQLAQCLVDYYPQVEGVVPQDRLRTMAVLPGRPACGSSMKSGDVLRPGVNLRGGAILAFELDGRLRFQRFYDFYPPSTVAGDQLVVSAAGSAVLSAGRRIVWSSRRVGRGAVLSPDFDGSYPLIRMTRNGSTVDSFRVP